MSFEGRNIYICKMGHLSQVDCYEDTLYKCDICGEPVEFVGAVDDTNGEATCRFYRKEISPRKVRRSFDKETNTETITINHDRVEIVKTPNKWYNFDTNKEYK